MGRFRHDAIIVTSMFDEMAKTAQEKAEKLGLEVTPVVTAKINGVASFLIIPDGSKEGWEDSDNAEKDRQEWIRWAREMALPDNFWIEWVHVTFGGDEPKSAYITEHYGEGEP